MDQIYHETSEETGPMTETTGFQDDVSGSGKSYEEGLDPLLRATLDLVRTHAARSQIAASELPGEIRQIHETLRTLQGGAGLGGEVRGAAPGTSIEPGGLARSDESGEGASAGFKGARAPDDPALPIDSSVTHDYIYCLEDAKPMKVLKRHLNAAYGMTPEEYRQKWGLPHDYPMVAPAYSEKRKDMALRTGLGRKPDDIPAPPPTELAAQGEPTPPEDDDAPSSQASAREETMGLFKSDTDDAATEEAETPKTQAKGSSRRKTTTGTGAKSGTQKASGSKTSQAKRSPRKASAASASDASISGEVETGSGDPGDDATDPGESI